MAEENCVTDSTAKDLTRQSCNQRIGRSPSYISPVAGKRREGAWGVSDDEEPVGNSANEEHS
jgi:hypothetical protein